MGLNFTLRNRWVGGGGGKEKLAKITGLRFYVALIFGYLGGQRVLYLKYKVGGGGGH